MTLVTFPTDFDLAGELKTGLLANRDNIDALDDHHASSGDPGHRDGRVRYAGGFLQLSKSGTWEIIQDMQAQANRDFNLNQALQLVLEKLATGSLGLQEARLQWDQTLKRAVVGDGTLKQLLAQCANDKSTFVALPCRLGVAGLATPATAATGIEGEGWLLDAAAEELTVQALQRIPAGYAGGADLKLVVHALLANAETANDDIDLSGEYVSVTPGVDAWDKAAASIAAVTHDIGATAIGQYAAQAVELAIPHSTAGNEIAAGDILAARINHDAAGQVGGIIVTGAELLVPVFNFHAE